MIEMDGMEPDLESGDWVYDENADDYVYIPGNSDPETKYAMLNVYNYSEYWDDDDCADSFDTIDFQEEADDLESEEKYYNKLRAKHIEQGLYDDKFDSRDEARAKLLRNV